MRTMVVFGVALGLVACGSVAQGIDPAPAASAVPRAAIVALQTRDHKVTLVGEGRVRVEDARGAIVADGVSIDALRAIDPFLYEACTSATARGPYLDATLHVDRGERGAGELGEAPR